MKVPSGSTSGALSTANVIGILALFCTMSEFTILTPSIATFSHHFVGTDITVIMFANSITGIISVPVSVASGALLYRVGFRPAAVAGVLVMSLGGAFPAFMPDITDYTYVIVSRVIVGIGLGVMFPIGNAAIIAFFDGERRARLLGLGVTIQFLFSLVYTTIAGYLTELGWNWSFLTYLIGLAPLAAVIAWMPEGKAIAAARRVGGIAKGAAARERLPWGIWGYALFGLAVWTCVVTVQVVTSTILDQRALADAGEAALVINCCGIGSIACGLAFPYLVRLFKARLFGVAALLVVVALIPCYFADSSIMYAMGVLCLGFGGSAFFTAAQNAAGNLAPRSRVPFVSGIMSSMMNLGPFVGPYVFAAAAAGVPSLGSDAIFPVLGVIAAAAALIGLIHPMESLVLRRGDVAGSPSFASEDRTDGRAPEVAASEQTEPFARQAGPDEDGRA